MSCSKPSPTPESDSGHQDRFEQCPAAARQPVPMKKGALDSGRTLALLMGGHH
jgi:hypothetical protein